MFIKIGNFVQTKDYANEKYHSRQSMCTISYRGS